ncbi:MAG: hypothetical protein ABSH56_09345 [Bryobacteraceae bacterium]
MLQEGELEKDVELAAEMLAGPGTILIVLDTDGDCPAELGPRPALTALFDIGLARSCKSFDRLCRLFQEIVGAAAP